MPRRKKILFEEKLPIIEVEIRKRRNKWQLNVLKWMSFEDVEQIIKLHVFKKWHMWDQSKALEPWLSRIITNQIRNLIRNNYTNYVKPCMNCPYNLGDEFCALNISGNQDSSCEKYAIWEKSKKHGYNIKLPLELENHSREVEEISWDQVDFSQSIDLLNKEMKKVLSENYFRAYEMLFFEKKTDEDVAKFLGYRSSEKNRKIGYKQIKNLKKLFRDKAIEILKNKDIL
jgi:DNA-directed RNA polymerase specialized sigma24 family protein